MLKVLGIILLLYKFKFPRLLFELFIIEIDILYETNFWIIEVLKTLRIILGTRKNQLREILQWSTKKVGFPLWEKIICVLLAQRNTLSDNC